LCASAQRRVASGRYSAASDTGRCSDVPADLDYLDVEARTAADLDALVARALAKVVRRAGRTTGGRAGSLLAEPTKTVQRTWFDTFDWRLQLAGLTLERRATAKVATLVLSFDGGQLVATDTRTDAHQPKESDAGTRAAPNGPRLAVRLDALAPAGPLRDRLAKVVDMRALFDVATVTSRMSTTRVLDDDGKTVARVVVDQSAVVDGREKRALAHRIRVVALRGYDAEAGAVATALGGVAGLVGTAPDRAGGSPRHGPVARDGGGEPARGAG
jgi:hypothetical protein